MTFSLVLNIFLLDFDDDGIQSEAETGTEEDEGGEEGGEGEEVEQEGGERGSEPLGGKEKQRGRLGRKDFFLLFSGSMAAVLILGIENLTEFQPYL